MCQTPAAVSGVLPGQQRVLLEASQKKAVPEKPCLNPPAQSHSDILQGWIWKPRSGVETGLMVAPYLNLTLSNVPKNKARARGSVSSVTRSKYLPADEQFTWSSITRSGSLVPRDAITQISPSKGAPPPGSHRHPGPGTVPMVELGCPQAPRQLAGLSRPDPPPTDINTSWLGPQATAIIFGGGFICHVLFVFRPGCATCSRAAGQALVSFDTDGGTHGERGPAKVGRASLLVSHPLRKAGKCGTGIPLLGGFPLTFQHHGQVQPRAGAAPFWEGIMQTTGGWFWLCREPRCFKHWTLQPLS